MLKHGATPDHRNVRHGVPDYHFRHRNDRPAMNEIDAAGRRIVPPGTGRYAAADARLRRGTADPPGAAGPLRHPAGRAGRRAQPVARSAGRGPQADGADRRRRRRDRRRSARSRFAASTALSILTESHCGYPRLLREIHDPPGVLFVRGELRPQDALAMAIVGTRHATPLRPPAGRAAGRQPGPRRADDRQRAGAGDRCGGPSRRPGGGRPHPGRARQRRAERSIRPSTPPWPTKSPAPRGAAERIAARRRTVGRDRSRSGTGSSAGCRWG